MTRNDLKTYFLIESTNDKYHTIYHMIHCSKIKYFAKLINLSLRTKFDFDVVDKLSNPNQIPKKSKSNYEIYEEYRNKNTSSKTKGYYQSDAE